MKIKDLAAQLNLYKKVNKSSNEKLSKIVGFSPKTIQRTIDESEVKNLDLFVRLGKLINAEYLIKNGIVTQTNNVNINSGTVQNVIGGDAQIIEALRNENELLKSRIQDLEKIVTLLEKSK